METTPFIPHPYATILRLGAFREGAMPESAYQKLIMQYNAVDDIRVSRVIYKNNGLAITGILASPAPETPIKGIISYQRGGSGNFGMLTVYAVLRQFIPLARAGYIVIGSNYRGNDGGEGKEEFGGADVVDAITLLGITRAKHPALPVYLIGHSRGGMMTALMLKAGIAANAAIIIAGVSDLTQGLNRPEMEKVYKRYIPDFDVRREEALIERSAVYWPEVITCPLLLLHGTKDDAVPHTQSEALAALLTDPHELVIYEGGNHALTRHWDEVLAKTLNWIDLYTEK